MLRNIKQLYGHKLSALDGDIGHIKDFYFDDQTWVVRYLVVDTGSWLSGRQVLLSPHSFGKWDDTRKTLSVNLKKKQIEDSPSPEAHRPVSRQYEIEFYRYYGWPAYWEGTDVWGLGGFPVALPPPMVEPHPQQQHRDDKHLRSTHSVNGYHIQALDGTIGQVTGFSVDDRQWTIHDLVVETHWFVGKDVRISSKKIERISYEESKVFVSLTQADIEGTEENKIARHHANKVGQP